MTVSYINRGDLRRSAIHLLQSMLALPLHFSNMHIKVNILIFSLSIYLSIFGCKNIMLFDKRHRFLIKCCSQNNTNINQLDKDHH